MGKAKSTVKNSTPKPKPNADKNRGLLVSQVNILKEIFVNRTDCYCVQLKQGYSKVAEPLIDETLLKHLSGEITVGSYQLDSCNYVKWLCFDFDPEKLPDPKNAAKQVLSILLEKRKEEDGTEKPRVWPSCIILEASRYPDPSYHIWVLFLVPVKAKVAKWLGLRILEMARVNPKQMEVFPKQNELTPEKPYGNFVKLPLGKHQVEGKWSRILDLETFEPLPSEEIENKHGLSFSEKDIETLEAMETKRNVQVTFEAPQTFKKLSDKDEEKTVQFLTRYWQPGYRNDLSLSFCGMCIKQGISCESAKRVIEEVCKRTGTSSLDTSEFLGKVDYQYTHRMNIGNLKGTSGIREVVDAIRNRKTVLEKPAQ